MDDLARLAAEIDRYGLSEPVGARLAAAARVAYQDVAIRRLAARYPGSTWAKACAIHRELRRLAVAMRRGRPPRDEHEALLFAIGPVSAKTIYRRLDTRCPKPWCSLSA